MFTSSQLELVVCWAVLAVFIWWSLRTAYVLVNSYLFFWKTGEQLAAHEPNSFTVTLSTMHYTFYAHLLFMAYAGYVGAYYGQYLSQTNHFYVPCWLERLAPVFIWYLVALSLLFRMEMYRRYTTNSIMLGLPGCCTTNCCGLVLTIYTVLFLLVMLVVSAAYYTAIAQTDAKLDPVLGKLYFRVANLMMAAVMAGSHFLIGIFHFLGLVHQGFNDCGCRLSSFREALLEFVQLTCLVGNWYVLDQVYAFGCHDFECGPSAGPCSVVAACQPQPYLQGVHTSTVLHALTLAYHWSRTLNYTRSVMYIRLLSLQGIWLYLGRGDTLPVLIRLNDVSAEEREQALELVSLKLHGSYTDATPADIMKALRDVAKISESKASLYSKGVVIPDKRQPKGEN